MSLVTVSECGKGVNKDLLASELAPGLWSDSLNVSFGNGFARKRNGIQAVYTTPGVVPYYIQTFNTATARFLIRAGVASVFVDDGSSPTDITGTPPTGGRDDRWTGGDFNSVLILNNGVDEPFYWTGDTSDNLAALTAWPAGYVADTLRPFKDYLVAGGIDKGAGVKYPQLVMWSSATEPGSIPTTWTAATTNDAGDDPLAGMGAVVDFLPLGEVNIVYCQEGRAAMQYIGGNEVFRIVPLPGKDGLKARGCVVETPKGHVFLSNGDVMIHTGGDAVSIAEGRVRNWIFSTMDTTNANRAFLCLNPQETEVWVVFPSTGSTDCDTVAAWNWVNDSWAIHSVSGVTYGASGLVASLSGGTWAADSGTWDSDVTTWDQDEFSSNAARLLLATSTPQIGLANTGSLDFGARVDWYLEKDGISLGDTDTLKVLSRCRPHLKAVAGTQVVVKLSSTMNPDDSPVFNNSSTYTQGTSNWANQFANAGRYAAVRFEGADDQTFAIRSFDFELAQSRARF